MIEKFLPYSFVIVAFIVVGVIIVIKKRRFIKHATSATGIVKALDSHYGNSGGSYQQIVEFETDQGKTITIKSVMAGKNKKSVGSAVTVLYQKDKPDHGVINSFWNLWGIEFTLFIISASIIAVILSEA